MEEHIQIDPALNQFDVYMLVLFQLHPFLVMLSGEGYAGYQFFQQKVHCEGARFPRFFPVPDSNLVFESPPAARQMADLAAR